jgi:GDPmannose 4,6-dehydratase
MRNSGKTCLPLRLICRAKLYAYWSVLNYREAYNLFASHGILFNHESPRHGETFVTRKFARAFTPTQEDIFDKLSLGNINSKRGWRIA